MGLGPFIPRLGGWVRSLDPGWISIPIRVDRDSRVDFSRIYTSSEDYPKETGFPMTRRAMRVVVPLTAALLAGLGWWRWGQEAPKREALATVRNLASALNEPGPAGHVLQLLALPASLAGRTPAEKLDFVHKALRDEISKEGVSALQRYGQFGPLKEIFPQQAEAWATQAGVPVQACVAFKLERNGQLAEVVLVRGPTPDGPRGFQIVRVNNVKQMAVGKL